VDRIVTVLEPNNKQSYHEPHYYSLASFPSINSTTFSNDLLHTVKYALPSC